MAAEDAKRLGGELPNSFTAGHRVILVRRPRGAIGVISPWNWPYTMPAELSRPRSQRATRSCGRRRPRPPSAPACWLARRRRRPAARRLQLRNRAGAGRGRRARRATPTWPASASSARPRRGARRRAAAGKRRCSRWAATGRWS